MNARAHDPRSVRHAALRIAAGLVPALVGGLLALLVVTPVLGHADLESSDPADKAVLDTSPTAITLSFSEGVDKAKSSFRLLGPDGSMIGTGAAAKDGDDTMTLDGLALGAGAYTIEWTSVADDGDILRGKLSFAVNAATPAPATASPTASAAAASASSTASATLVATPAPSPSADAAPASSSSTDVLLPIIVALALVAVVGALVLRRNRAA
jgi:copper resistance protein C